MAGEVGREGKERGRPGSRNRWIQNLLGLSTDLIGLLVENWPRGNNES